MAALTLGVAGTTAQAATETTRSAPVASTMTPSAQAASHQAFVRYLDSAEGRQVLNESGLSKAQISAVRSGDTVVASGWVDRLKKAALKRAFKALPKSWQTKLTGWAKHGKAYFLSKWNTLPGWVKKALTLGGALTAKTVVEWLIDIIL
ncbi:MAG: hypothetical protein LBV60_16585 [Streptomyces sp.]|nr:hypothetical protein [Streptomyces sp.]